MYSKINIQYYSFLCLCVPLVILGLFPVKHALGAVRGGRAAMTVKSLLNRWEQRTFDRAENLFEQTFKNIDDVLHKDAGCGSELDYVEQSSWVLFLKYLDDLEKERESAASLSGKPYEPILRDEYRWGVWAMPRKEDGEIDHHAALIRPSVAKSEKKYSKTSQSKRVRQRFCFCSTSSRCCVLVVVRES